jgi:imidazolonepropionase-like amidohydrolase
VPQGDTAAAPWSLRRWSAAPAAAPQPGAIGLEAEIGTIAPGKAADIVAVAGDPLTDPRTLQKMRFVMAAGRIVPLD